MLKTFTIENYKSIERMTLNLGRVNVLIGENGAGKSNILEAMALAGAAQAGKLDNEFLSSRGIRAVKPNLMRSAFPDKGSRDIVLSSTGSNDVVAKYVLQNDDGPYSSWSVKIARENFSKFLTKERMLDLLASNFADVPDSEQIKALRTLAEALTNAIDGTEDGKADTQPRRYEIIPQAAKFMMEVFPEPDDNLSDFVVFSPEHSSLRVFEHESQIEPLGVHGEGLLKLLTVLEKDKNSEPIKQIKSALCMLGWFSGYVINQDDAPRMDITDRFLANGTTFDQRSANEGFLYIAFYFALFCSNLTPSIFAIDNIDASLNPKLCRAMIAQLSVMAARNNKQVILTTHNPAVLDGLDLADDAQRLFVIERDMDGRTQAFRRHKPQYEGKPRKLSELFMAGTLGGLPTEF